MEYKGFRAGHWKGNVQVKDNRGNQICQDCFDIGIFEDNDNTKKLICKGCGKELKPNWWKVEEVKQEAMQSEARHSSQA